MEKQYYSKINNDGLCRLSSSFLLAVPAETKALRTADLIQLNLQEAAKKYDLTIDDYNTYLFIKVELDINTWFIPKKLLTTNNAGMITVEWCQGY